MSDFLCDIIAHSSGALAMCCWEFPGQKDAPGSLCLLLLLASEINACKVSAVENQDLQLQLALNSDARAAFPWLEASYWAELFPWSSS